MTLHLLAQNNSLASVPSNKQNTNPEIRGHQILKDDQEFKTKENMHQKYPNQGKQPTEMTRRLNYISIPEPKCTIICNESHS